MRPLFLLLLTILCFTACTRNNSKPATEAVDEGVLPEPKTEQLSGKQLFEKHCITCHGSAGDLGLAGAKNLKVCSKSIEEIQAQIWNGKNSMPPFKTVLPYEDTRLIAEYVLTLGKADSANAK